MHLVCFNDRLGHFAIFVPLQPEPRRITGANESAPSGLSRGAELGRLKVRAVAARSERVCSVRPQSEARKLAGQAAVEWTNGGDPENAKSEGDAARPRCLAELRAEIHLSGCI